MAAAQDSSTPFEFRPTVLKGHSRPITFLKYNRDGDLLFVSAKDNAPSVWFTDNGERLGTFKGHGGAVWCLDVDYETRRLITASGDQTARLWDVQTGTCLFTFPHRTAVRSCAFATGDKQFVTVTDSSFGNIPTIHIHNLSADLMESGNPSGQADVSVRQITGHAEKTKINSVLWGPLNKTILSAGDDCTLRLWDAETGTQIAIAQDHKKSINSISMSQDQSCVITASSDMTSRLYDARTLKFLKEYQTERPVNAAVISPNTDHVLLGGGQEAASVTTTASSSGKFEVRFFHKIFEDEIAQVKGHFGPVNALAIQPGCKAYASGGEDGFVRIHPFPEAYFKLQS
eukprot:TRINITY_DN1316_c0_g1_i1.p1 TRINITY_DN1316_c0_g1~~TRINITY_DN1316_c0_g1_i1.p1  ORF type:complete len:344 (-),score=87.34 TRINITY_DN1316_c0_g1_i1:45-1076(-)